MDAYLPEHDTKGLTIEILPPREAMQLWHILHSSSGLFLIAVALGHMYLGSIGTEGVLEGMTTGEVDEGFAKQHHSLWYEEVKGSAKAAEGEAAAGTST